MQSQRYINLTPAVAFGLTILSTWPSLSLTLQAGLYNGGPTALVWGMLLATIGSSCIAAVLGEMASMSVFSAPSISYIKLNPGATELHKSERSIDGPHYTLLEGPIPHFGVCCKVCVCALSLSFREEKRQRKGLAAELSDSILTGKYCRLAHGQFFSASNQVRPRS